MILILAFPEHGKLEHEAVGRDKNPPGGHVLKSTHEKRHQDSPRRGPTRRHPGSSESG